MPTKATLYPKTCRYCQNPFMGQRLQMNCSYRCGSLGRVKITPQARFESKIVPGNSGCMLWVGGRCSSGYGSIAVGGKTIGAHRYAWELNCGPVPEGLCVLHRCDVRRCVNPSHLFLGTALDNIADMKAKNRQAKGSIIWKRRREEAEKREATSADAA